MFTEDERDDTYAHDWTGHLMPVQSQRDRSIRCAVNANGVPCGTRPATDGPGGVLAALVEHVRTRHLATTPTATYERLRAGSYSYPVKAGSSAYLYVLADGRAWCFAGSDRDYAAYASAPAEQAVEPEPVAAPAQELACAF